MQPQSLPTETKPEQNAEYIILFDGVCNLCNGSVQFIIRNDKRNRFKFAALQSEAGQKIVQKIQEQKGNTVPESIVLVAQGRYRFESTAVLHIARLLGFPWLLFFPLILVPPVLRNYLYRFVGKNRYRWFGQRAACMMPSPALKERFL